MSKKDSYLASNSSDTESYERVETEQSEYEDSVIDDPMSSSTFISIRNQLPIFQQPFVDEYLSKKSSSNENLLKSVATEDDLDLTGDEQIEIDENEEKEDTEIPNKIEEESNEDKKLKKLFEKIKHWATNLKRHHLLCFLSLVIMFVTLMFMLFLFFNVSDQLGQCQLQNQELVKNLEFLASDGQINSEHVSDQSDDSVMSLMNKDNLYYGRCKKLRFKTLEKWGIIKKPGSIVICI